MKRQNEKRTILQNKDMVRKQSLQFLQRHQLPHGITGTVLLIPSYKTTGKEI